MVHVKQQYYLDITQNSTSNIKIYIFFNMCYVEHVDFRSTRIACFFTPTIKGAHSEEELMEVPSIKNLKTNSSKICFGH